MAMSISRGSDWWCSLVVQGEDLGYIVARFLALNYESKHVKAHHVNNVAPAKSTTTTHLALYAKVQATSLSDNEKVDLGRSE